MLTAFTPMPLVEGTHLEHKSFTAMPSTVRSGEWVAGCLPLALGPAFTQGAPTICIIATPARTTDKQASWLDTAGH